MTNHPHSTEGREEVIASLRSLKYQETSRSGVMTIPLIAVLMADYHGQELLEILADFILSDRQSTRKKTASEIFNLAHEYAQQDETLIGSEELRAYHYYNAIHKIGEFDGR